MRVGILLGPNGRGGMERQAFLLARGLVSRKIYTKVIFNSRPSWSREGMDWGSIPYQYLWRFRPIEKFNQKYLSWILEKNRIDILHVFFWGNMEFAIGSMATSKNVKFIGSQRDTDFVTNIDIKERLANSCSYYQYITCNSKVTRSLMDSLKICSPDKVKVIYNGVVVPNNSNKMDEISENGPTKNILFPNRFFSYKNPLLFIEACAEICRTFSDVRVLFAGCGDQLSPMKDLCEKLNIMHKSKFLGSLLPEEVPYKEAHVVVNCSSSLEGMSNVLLESLANGVPVVATEVGGNPELLRNFPFGRLIPIGDKDALVSAMSDFLSLSDFERADLAKKARDYMLQMFSVDSFVEEHISFYSHVLASN